MQLSLVLSLSLSLALPYKSDYKELMMDKRTAVCRCRGYQPDMKTVMLVFTK